MYRIQADNGSFDVNSSREDTVLSAVLRAGVGFPYECNSGGCGACKFELIDGQVAELDGEFNGLSPRDKRKGRKLACQCSAVSDLTIKAVNPDQGVADYLPERFKARLKGKTSLSDEMFMLAFEADREVVFTPGQYFMVQFPSIGARAYSAANTVHGNSLTLIIKAVPGGLVSNELVQSDLGLTLELDGPYGLTGLKRSDETSSVFIAGGSGIAPMVSMVNTLADLDYAKPMTVIYGSRLEEELLAASELFRPLSNLNLVTVLSDAPEESAWNGERGYVHEVISKYIDDTEKTEFYLCGPPPMITATQKVLMLERKVPFERIHFDRFY